MLETVLMVVDFIVCVALIGAVLLQTGRGAGLSSSFGGGDGAFFGKGNDLDTVLSQAGCMTEVAHQRGATWFQACGCRLTKQC